MLQNKKILLVSSAFYPEISPRSFRATELAKEFLRRGFDVTVISKYRDHDYSVFLMEYPISFKMWKEPFLPKVPVFQKEPFSSFTRAVSRILSILFEYPAIEEVIRVKNILKNENGYDLMISFAVPFTVHWGVASIRSVERSIAEVWIADCGDPYMFARLDRFRKPFYFKYFELLFSRKCDYISVPFREMRAQFYSEFYQKIEVIPQGFDFNALKLYKGPINNIIPVFIFAGSIIPGKRDLELFLGFLSTMSKGFLFVVYTNQDKWFDNYKSILGEKLQLRSYIDRLSLIYEMSKADFLVNVDTVYDNPSNVEAVPSKLIDYALSGRPILSIHSAQLDKVKIIEFLNGDYSKKRIIDKSRYDITGVSAKFLELAKNSN